MSNTNSYYYYNVYIYIYTCVYTYISNYNNTTTNKLIITIFLLQRPKAGRPISLSLYILVIVLNCCHYIVYM